MASSRSGIARVYNREVVDRINRSRNTRVYNRGVVDRIDRSHLYNRGLVYRIDWSRNALVYNWGVVDRINWSRIACVYNQEGVYRIDRSHITHFIIKKELIALINWVRVACVIYVIEEHVISSLSTAHCMHYNRETSDKNQSTATSHAYIIEDLIASIDRSCIACIYM